MKMDFTQFLVSKELQQRKWPRPNSSTSAHLPECIGEDADAIGAYTQIPLADAARLLGMNVLPETWISLPKERWPKDGSWDHIKNPVCPLLLNLYGHPLAGLLWEKGCQEKLLAEGFELSLIHI